MMPAADVPRVLERLAAVEVATWLDGGWGVDALLGRQTRAHDDLDLVVALDQSAAVEHALAPLGYALTSDERPTRRRMIMTDPGLEAWPRTPSWFGLGAPRSPLIPRAPQWRDFLEVTCIPPSAARSMPFRRLASFRRPASCSPAAPAGAWAATKPPCSSMARPCSRASSDGCAPPSLT